MIENFVSNSPNIIMSAPANTYISNNGPLAGQIRYNTNLQGSEVYDGTNWQRFGGTGSVGLSEAAETAIAWCQKKMVEEQKLTIKIEKYSALKSAYEQFKLVEALCYETKK